MTKINYQRKISVTISVISAVIILYTLYFIPNTTRAAAPTDGLVGYWAFEEQSGAVANDLSRRSLARPA